MEWALVTQVGNTLANENGKIRSLNPAHNEPPYGPYHWEEREPGAAGGYERCTVVGGVVWYNPTGKEPIPFPFVEHDPHVVGKSSLSVEPLKIDTVPL